MSSEHGNDTDRQQRLIALLEAALALPEDQRQAWLLSLPPAEQPVVPMLHAMLSRASVETDTFLQRPVVPKLGEVEAADAPADAPGAEVGPYRLISELGAGGMAVVWLAERADGVLHRHVALKLPRAGWALGLARRMARERDILGALEHPHIGRLYDAGVTAEGRPWLAMEYVAGVPIDTHCNARGLDVRQRLQLFLQVADAVAHAHARLIVHRDLKPSNILVTPEGEVRLLDFGVAKLLEEDPALAPAITQLMGRAVTPDYASPEQVAGKPVTVATDVYSLGVVLYELLTGQRPYRLARHSAAALEEAILASPVAPASSRVGADRKLARSLRGDIDTLLNKALRKNPALRYTSVEAFAADVKRHLGGEPVLAQAPSRRYRSLKFALRHRTALAAAAAVSAALVFGLGAALWQAGQARTEAARAEQVKAFIASVLKQARPREGVGGVVTAIDLLTAASQRIDKELASNPRLAAELGVIVGQGFYSLGQALQGEAPLRAAIVRGEASLGKGHPIVLHGKALLLESMDAARVDEMDRLLADLLPAVLTGLPATAEDAVFALRSQSYLLANRGLRQASLASLNQAIEIGERHLGPNHRDTILALGLMSNTLGRFGERAEQLKVASEALARAQAAFGALRPHPTLTAIERRQGDALLANELPGDAAQVLARALKDRRALDAADTYRVLSSTLQLALALSDAGRMSEALAQMRDAVALHARLNPADAAERSSFAEHLFELLTLLRRDEQAQALQARFEAPGAGSGAQPEREPVAIARAIGRARLLALQGDATAAAREAAAAAARAGDEHPNLHSTAQALVSFNARMQGRPADAQALMQRMLASPRFQTLSFGVQALVASEAGLAWLDLGHAARAEQSLLMAQALYARAQVEPGVRMSDTLVGLARVQLRAGRAAEAEALLLPLVTAWESANPRSVWHGEALHWLAHAEALAGKARPAAAHRLQARSMLQASRLPALQRLSAG
jgi:eukaryotic-like serine/threonine-protein kinase